MLGLTTRTAFQVDYADMERSDSRYGSHAGCHCAGGRTSLAVRGRFEPPYQARTLPQFQGVTVHVFRRDVHRMRVVSTVQVDPAADVVVFVQ